jgi:hypothetical protein
MSVQGAKCSRQLSFSWRSRVSSVGARLVVGDAGVTKPQCEGVGVRESPQRLLAWRKRRSHSLRVRPEREVGWSSRLPQLMPTLGALLQGEGGAEVNRPVTHNPG